MPEKKKVKEAAALKYSPGKNNAPEIVALGKGETAERIIKKAKESKVPLYEDAALAHTLNFFNIGSEIPPELYAVVAQILVFVGRLDIMSEGNGRLEEKTGRMSVYKTGQLQE